MPYGQERRRSPGPLGELQPHLPPERAALAEELRRGRTAMAASLHELAAKTYSSKASVSRWLSGRTLPTLEQAELWAAICGTDPDRMRILWRAAQHPDQPPDTPDAAAEAPPPRLARRSMALEGAAILATVLLTVAGGDGGAHPGPSALAAAECPAPSLRLPADTGEPFPIEVTPGCAPPPGRQRWIVVQLEDVGHDRHRLYYLKWHIPYPSAPYAIESRPAAQNNRRTYYVIDVGDEEYRRLLDSPRTQDGGLFDLGRAAVVSNRASNTNSGPAVVVNASPAGRRAVVVFAEIRRPARPGHVYWFVLEVHDVGGTHSEFYPRQSLPAANGEFRLTIPPEADLSRRRTGAVYEVPEAQSDLLRSGRPDPVNPEVDYLLTAPCPCRSSNEIQLDFTG